MSNLLRFACSDFLLPISCLLLRLQTLLFALQLIRSPNGNVFRLVVAKQHLQNLLNTPATDVVQDHRQAQSDLELGGERHELQLLVDLRHELSRAREGHRGDEHNTPVHALVLLDGLAEWPTLVIDGERGDLLDELQKIDGRVEKRGLKLLLQIDLASRRLLFELVDVVGDVDQSDDMHNELPKHGGDDVPIPDVVLRPLLRERFDSLENMLAS